MTETVNSKLQARHDALLREFWPETEQVEALLKSKYSAASGIELNHGVLVVNRFDEDAYRLLSELQAIRRTGF